MAFLFAKSFPFCVQDAGETPTGNGTQYPLGMSLEAVMELFWKCKTFNLTGSIALSFFIQLPGVQKYYTINDSYSTEVLSLGYWPPKMSDMICSEQPYFYGEGYGAGTIVTSNDPTGRNSEPYFFTNMFNPNTAEVIKKDNLFYPHIALIFAPGQEYGSVYSNIQYTFYPQFVEAPNALSVSLDSGTFSCSMYAYPGSPYSFLPKEDIVFTGSIVISKSSDRLAE